MDTMLLVVTVVALTVAAVSTTVAWQVTQADRRRRAGRIAALAAAAGVPDVAVVPDPSPLVETPIADAPAVALPEGGVALADRFLAADTSGSGSAGRQQWLLGGATFVAALVLSIGVVSLVNARRPAAAEAATPAPLELVALAHNRAAGVLTVSGLVRNPAAGRAVDKLEAEVRVFDPAGILIATRTALVDYLELAPGQESPFVVALGEAATAARYRVSFRTAGTMRPHVDQRTNAPASVDRTAEAR
jgi:uncharacterized membrane protein